jgi:hypothetical protein
VAFIANTGCNRSLHEPDGVSADPRSFPPSKLNITDQARRYFFLDPALLLTFRGRLNCFWDRKHS